jgi:glycosyltransferase involved in cell wall biosynthesis
MKKPLRVVMLLLNEMTRDARVEREASLLAGRGLDVRVLALCGPGLPFRERRRGFEILRFDQRDRLTRWADEKIMARFRRRKKAAPASEKGQPDPGHLEYIRLLNRIFAKEAARLKPDIIHCHDLDMLEAGIMAGERSGRPLIYDAHELWSEQSFALSGTWNEYFESLEKKLIPRADRVLTVNDSLAAELARRYAIPIPMVVRNCPPLQPLTPPGGEMLKLSSTGRKILLYHGIFTEHRGLESLILAMASIGDAILALRGCGPLKEPLRVLARENGLEDRVRFLEPVPPGDLVSSSTGAAAGLLPILPMGFNNTYCLPNKVFEYMMAGLALLVSDLPELERLVSRSGAGITFRAGNEDGLGNAIKELIRDPEKLNKCQKAARKAAEEEYNWEKEGERLLDIYRDLGVRVG